MAPEPGERYWLGKHAEHTPNRYGSRACRSPVLCAHVAHAGLAGASSIATGRISGSVSRLFKAISADQAIRCVVWREGRFCVRVSRMLRPPDARARSIGTAPMAPTMSPISDVVEPGWRQRVAAWRDELWPASELWPLAGQPAARASPPPRGAASFSGVGCGALSCLPCVGFVTVGFVGFLIFFTALQCKLACSYCI